MHCRSYAPTFCGQLLLVLALAVLPLIANEFGPPPRFFGDVPVSSASTLLKEVGSIDVHDRAAVVSLFQTAYLASEGVPMQWDGDVTRCVAGTNGLAFTEATLLRVNYYRAMCGLTGDITLNAEWNEKCQQAALMMAAESRLSHQPDRRWACYTEAGAEAAGESNLYHGRAGASAIDGYMDDWGVGNHAVGHRRWILYPPQRIMGTGSVPTAGGRLGANALWVVGGFGPRPTEPVYIAWPPSGFVPYQLLPKVSQRWSFSIAGAGFSEANVSMSCAGTNVPLALEPLANNHGYGDSTLVWVPQGLSSRAPAQDLECSVTVSNVILNGKRQSFSYPVTIIDPNGPEPQLPNITKQPEDQTVTLGAPALFSAQASGSTPLVYQWWFQGNNVPGQTNTVYSLPRVEASDLGGYSVVVTNPFGAVTSRVAVLSVRVPAPRLEFLPEGVLHWKGLAHLRYGIETSTNLSLSDWHRIDSIASEDSAIYYTNVVSSEPYRFYRLVYP
jgi:hypothetical protein